MVIDDSESLESRDSLDSVPRVDSSSLSLYLARHGRTVLNADGVLRGHLDPSLDEVGQLEAEALATALGSFQPTLIVSSPLRRALETAWNIAFECGIAVEVDERLIDRDYGQWAGQTIEGVERQWGRVDDAPSVEPRETVLERAREALDSIAARGDEAAVVVAHDAINRLLLDSFDRTRYTGPDEIPQRTGCFNILQCSDGRSTIVRVDIHPTSGSIRSGPAR